MDNKSDFNKIIDIIKQKLSDNNCKTLLIGVSGIPGSGKSTFCNRLSEALENSVVIPLDGYHLYRENLTQEQMMYRGRYDTFDMDKFKSDFLTLKGKLSSDIYANTDKEIMSFPSFDHSVKDPKENDIKVFPHHQFIICEGLYLFINSVDLVKEFDVKIFLTSDIGDAMGRVAKRNFEAGISESYEKSVEITEKNDKKNAEFVLANSAIENSEMMILNYISDEKY